MQDLFSAFLRTIVAFLLLLVVIRLMGRKAINQMSNFDFGVTLALGTLTAHISEGAASYPLKSGVVLLTLGALAILFGYLSIQSVFFRKLANSEPTVLIQNGEIVKENMEKTRVSLTQLTSLLRQKNTFNIADVEFAILETDGELSVEPKSQKQPLTPSDLHIPTSYKGLTKELIIDGQVLEENLMDVRLNRAWLMRKLNEKGINRVEEVFFAALDSSGSLYVSKGLKGKEKEGQYGIE